MKWLRRIPRAPWMVLAAAILIAGCCRPPAHTITQVSTIGALLAGAYDGQIACAELRRYGDLGIGTFDRLDGEMVVLDGTVYQVRADGSVRVPPGTTTTPTAMVARFTPEIAVPLDRGMEMRAFEARIDRAFPEMNLFCAVRARGRFSAVKTRSVPTQEKPYPPLVQVTKAQSVFEREGISGTLLGFRSPGYAGGITVPGYHLHFLSDDRAFGGHVLDFTLDSGTAEIDPCTRFLLVLPGAGSAFGRMDLGGDRSADLETAERADAPTR